MLDILAQADIARNQERTRAAGLQLMPSVNPEFGDVTTAELWLAGELAVPEFAPRSAPAGWTWHAAARTVTGPVRASVEALFPTLVRTHAPLAYVHIAPEWLTDTAVAAKAAACTPVAWQRASEWLPPQLLAAVAARPVEECLAALPTSETVSPFANDITQTIVGSYSRSEPEPQRVVGVYTTNQTSSWPRDMWIVVLIVAFAAVIAAGFAMRHAPATPPRDMRPFSERAATMPQAHFERELATITAAPAPAAMPAMPSAMPSAMPAMPAVAPVPAV